MAYQPRQPCETYFVESNDTSYPPPRAHHEMIKIQGRMKQQAMADELSRQACDAYMDDIVDHMAQMEVISLRSLYMYLADIFHRRKLFQMSPRSIFSPRSSGS